MTEAQDGQLYNVVLHTRLESWDRESVTIPASLWRENSKIIDDPNDADCEDGKIDAV
jgi:hypothetical protein